MAKNFINYLKIYYIIYNHNNYKVKNATYNDYEYCQKSVGKLINKFMNNKLFSIESMKQNKKQEIRYLRYDDFNDKIAKEFLSRDLKSKDIKKLLIIIDKPKLYNEI